MDNQQESNRHYSKTRFIIYFIIPFIVFFAVLVIGSGIVESVCGSGWDGLQCALNSTAYVVFPLSLIATIGSVVILARRFSGKWKSSFVVVALSCIAILVLILISVAGFELGLFSDSK